MTYDYLVVGAGLFGSIFAQQATEVGKRVLVIDKRSHIGGNCFSERCSETGVEYHLYGTHIFHTNDDDIWAYVNRFAQFVPYRHRVLATTSGGVFPMPINLATINGFFRTSMNPREAAEFLRREACDLRAPKNLAEKAKSLVGERLYRAFIEGYTRKQWGTDPENLPARIITRLPVRLNYVDGYFDDKHQGIPLSYAEFFARLLEGVRVELNVDFFLQREELSKVARRIVFTGPIDAFFECSLGRLSWRSVGLIKHVARVGDYQGCTVMNYPIPEVPWTRVHEPKHMPQPGAVSGEATLVQHEFPSDDPENPAYPIGSEKDAALLANYQRLAREEAGNVVFGGRLASYRYLDMHQVVGAALATARKELAA